MTMKLVEETFEPSGRKFRCPSRSPSMEDLDMYIEDAEKKKSRTTTSRRRSGALEQIFQKPKQTPEKHTTLVTIDALLPKLDETNSTAGSTRSAPSTDNPKKSKKKSKPKRENNLSDESPTRSHSKLPQKDHSQTHASPARGAIGTQPASKSPIRLSARGRPRKLSLANVYNGSKRTIMSPELAGSPDVPSEKKQTRRLDRLSPRPGSRRAVLRPAQHQGMIKAPRGERRMGLSPTRDVQSATNTMTKEISTKEEWQEFGRLLPHSGISLRQNKSPSSRGIRKGSHGRHTSLERKLGSLDANRSGHHRVENGANEEKVRSDSHGCRASLENSNAGLDASNLMHAHPKKGIDEKRVRSSSHGRHSSLEDTGVSRLDADIVHAARLQAEEKKHRSQSAPRRLRSNKAVRSDNMIGKESSSRRLKRDDQIQEPTASRREKSGSSHARRTIDKSPSRRGVRSGRGEDTTSANRERSRSSRRKKDFSTRPI